jgi:hypothetical protein
MPRPSASLAGSPMTRRSTGTAPTRPTQMAARASSSREGGRPQSQVDEAHGRRPPLAMTNGAGGIVDASRSGLRLDPRMPFDAWKALGARIKVRSDASSWWLGDWLVFGRHQYGDRHKEAFEATGLDDQTLDNFGVVARRFESSRRRENLSFQHHADVCEMTDAAQDHWLNLAAKNGWPKSELRIRIRDAARTTSSLHDGHVLRLSLKVEAGRERAWRAAAARHGLRLEEWMVGVLDDAAD